MAAVRGRESRDPLRKEIKVTWWMWAGAYLVVGAALALRHISRGVVGSGGTVLTFIFVTLFWPLVVRS